MASQGFGKTSLFGATMIAGFAAAMMSSGPAWAQAGPTRPVPPPPGTSPPQPPADAPDALDEEIDDNDPQTSADGTPSDLEGVVVTGTRIRRPQFEGTIPGAQVDDVEIERRAFTNALDILNDIPLVGPGTSISTNGGQRASLGVAFVDLLDLGTERTLTLVNGRRFVGGNAGTLFVAGNRTGSQVDANVIPVSLIDRVDVLTVGGAAAYGSDAIAGVVNYILKDSYEGADIGAVYGTTEEGGGENYSVSALVGRNFLGDRANASISYEYNYLSSFYDDERDFTLLDPSTVTNFANGSLRNTQFNPRAIAGGSNTAFVNSGADLINATAYLLETSSSVTTDTGTIFQPVPTAPIVVGTQVGPLTTIGSEFTTALQIVPGTPVAACNGVGNLAKGNPICTFAPTALPAGTTAAQVFAAFGVTPPAGLTTAQANLLAVNILQSNRPTPREFFAANPNTNLNAFIGTFVAAFPDIANPDPATNQFLPRLAVPLRFNAAGNIETFTVATLNPSTPGTFGAAPGGQGDRTARFDNQRIEQDRQIGTFFGRLDITPSLEFFTENLIAEVKGNSPRNSASSNGAGNTGAETLALVVNINNPFLDADDRAQLAARGLTTQFILSRSNQDIFGDNPLTGRTLTMRSANGLRGDFGAFGRQFNWEASLTYGRAEISTRSQQVKDIEYILAIDAVRAPNGEIVCRSKLTPGIVGTTPPGIAQQGAVLPDANGVLRARLITPTVTQAQVDACVPLNPFGFNQMSEAAKAYVTGITTIDNVNEQTVGQAFIAGDLFQLPAGALGFSVAGEYRLETLDFRTDELNRQGFLRTAPSAQTQAETRAVEYGAEFLIPVFGGDFRFPFMHSLEISPAVRFSKLEGEAPTFIDLQGRTVTPEAEGDLARIYTLAATWQPIQDLTVRGNISRSIRQPSATELFLGAQPSFNAPTDPCSSGNIGSGPRPAVRRENCIADVLRLGLAPDKASAEAFLANFVASGVSRTGTFSGSPELDPEEGSSYTIGVVVQPRMIPRLRASVDYIDVELANQIINGNLTNNLNFCYDSPLFPNNEAAIGQNTCATFSRRNTDFNVGDGYTTGFINIAATRMKAYNISADYRFGIADALTYVGFPSDADLGDLQLRLNAFNLEEFATSGTGDFTDIQISTGSITAGRPTWETQFTAIYRRGPLDAGVTWNWESGSRIFSSGAFATAENFPFLTFEETSIWNSTIGYEFMDRYRVQFTVNNIFNVNFYEGRGGQLAAPTIGFFDTLGRRYRVSLRASF